MDPTELAEALRVARAAERMGFLGAGDWSDLAVALLLEGVEEPEVLELAGFNHSASPWQIEPLTASLYERHATAVPQHAEAAVAMLARLLAADLRARPSSVTGPMIRLLARLAPPDFESDLATQCFGAEEYLDCDCSGHVDPGWEAELEGLPGFGIPTPSPRHWRPRSARRFRLCNLSTATECRGWRSTRHGGVA